MSQLRGGVLQSQTGILLQPSDYESDGHFSSDIVLPSTQRTDEELNLSVLRRHNPDVISLEYVAPYAVVYQFSPNMQQWEKSGIEGTAFVCALQSTHESPERFEVIVLNRRGLENFKLELLSATDVEVTEEYIILNSTEDGKPEVYGLWVFSEPPPSSTSHHRSGIAQKIQECAKRVDSGRRLMEEQDKNRLDGQTDNNVPMERQSSLKELLGQQRKEDDAWNVRSHSPQRPSTLFTTSADTDFFRSTQRHVQSHPPAVSAQFHNGQGKDSLLNIFRMAGYRGSS